MASTQGQSSAATAPHLGPVVDDARDNGDRFEATELAVVLSHYELGVIRRIPNHRRGSRRAPKLRISAERGFLWEARVAVLGRLVMEGADWLLANEAGIDYALADWWPAVERRGPELARAAAGRMMVELAWLPAALTPQRGARWSRGDTDRAVVTVPGSAIPMTVLVSNEGRLLEASVLRRRVAPDGRSALAPYGIVVEAEARFGDFTVPSELVAAWGIGTDDRYDFMRVFVEDIDWL